jgi:hypothetical protein
MIGKSFAPLNSDPNRRRPGPSDVQEAIKILSLRVPRFVGGGAPIPLPLLMSPGSGAIQQPQQPAPQGPGQGPGQPGAPGFGLEDVLRRQFGLSWRSAPTPGYQYGDDPNAPPPHFIPDTTPSWDDPTPAPQQPQGPQFNARRDTKNPMSDGYWHGGDY